MKIGWPYPVNIEAGIQIFKFVVVAVHIQWTLCLTLDGVHQGRLFVQVQRHGRNCPLHHPIIGVGNIGIIGIVQRQQHTDITVQYFDRRTHDLLRDFLRGGFLQDQTQRAQQLGRLTLWCSGVLDKR